MRLGQLSFQLRRLDFRSGRSSDSRLSPVRPAAEPLEPRTLFSAPINCFIDSSLRSEDSPGPVSVTPGESIPVDVRVEFNESVGVAFPTPPAGSQLPADPTGTVTITDQNGTVIATLSLVAAGYDNGTIPYSTAATTIAVPTVLGTDADGVPSLYLNANYTGDGTYDSGSSGESTTDSSEWDPANSLLLQEPAVERLTFVQNPSDAAVDDILKPPVTVELLKPNGTVDTSASASVTLALNPSAAAGTTDTLGTGKLAGALSEPLVNGVATFSDLSINAGGEYGLTATDATASSVTSTNSSTFNITSGKLVFLKGRGPHDGAANEALNPAIIVELQDAKNKILTSSDGTTVTLSLVGVSSGAEITGTTAVLSGGKATFPAFTVKTPGFYQVVADDGGDTEAQAPKFKITGDHLAFARQPVDVDVNQATTFSVSLRDSKNHIDTSDNTDLVSVALNLPTGIDANLAGTTTLALHNGVASFTAAQGLKIDQPGNFTFTATPLDSGGILLPGASAVTSKTFNVGPYHLVVTSKPPATVGVGDPIRFIVKAYDKHNKLDTGLNDGFAVANAVPFSAGSLKDAANFTREFVNGVATFASPDPSVSTPDTYNVVISPQDALGNSLVGVSGTVQFIVKVQADHIAFKVQPVDVNFGTGPIVTAEIRDAHNKLVTAFDGDEATQVSHPINDSDGLGDQYGHTNPTFSNGSVTFSTASIDDGGTDEGHSGSWALEIGVDARTASGANPVTASTTRVFKIEPYHVVFTQQPTSAPIGGTTSATLALKDLHNHFVDTLPSGLGIAIVLEPADNSNEILSQVNAEQLEQTGTQTLTFPTSFAFANGIAPTGKLQIIVASSDSVDFAGSRVFALG